MAGLCFSLIANLPKDWSSESAQMWLFNSLGWFIALALCFLISYEKYQHNKTKETRAITYKKLWKKHSLLRKKSARQSEVVQEKNAEIKALVRANHFLFESIEQTSPIKRKSREEENDD